jgi:hypothetical protein
VSGQNPMYRVQLERPNGGVADRASAMLDDGITITIIRDDLGGAFGGERRTVAQVHVDGRGVARLWVDVDGTQQWHALSVPG